MLTKMVGEDHGLDKNYKVDLSRLPPCQDSLVPHTTRVNYRTACYKRANTPIFEKPKPHDQDQGWVIDDDGIIESKWSNGPVLPQSLIDLMADHSETEEDEDVDIEVEVDEYDTLKSHKAHHRTLTDLKTSYVLCLKSWTLH